MVIFFHYFSRWISLYPYGDKYDFFNYGKMGVQFFFIISGFVISFTLEMTSDFITFWKKRIIRLFPSMLIASLITYFFLNLFDTDFLYPESHYFKNVLASITFLSPDLLSSVFNGIVEFDYISGSYWSLWPEIQFYFFVSVIYYLNKNIFFELFFSLSFLLILGNFVIHHIYNSNKIILEIKSLLIAFNLIVSLPYFCFGVLFYFLSKNIILEKHSSVYIKICLLGLFVFQVYCNYSTPLRIFFISIFLLLFTVLIYYPELIRFLENKILVKIGTSSYFLYLIHENNGILMIYKYGAYLKVYEFIFPFVLILFLILISILYTYTIDKWINKLLKKIFLKKNQKLDTQKMHKHKLLNTYQKNL